MIEDNLVIQRIKDFEERYLIKFTLNFNMCKKLGIQRRRLQKIIDREIEPTVYECMVFERFLKLPNIGNTKIVK